MNESSRVANALTRGEIPWRFPVGIARNVRTGMPYCGVRPLLLNIAAGAFDWTSPWFGTLEDHTAVGNTVKPELGVRIPGCPDAVYNLDQTDQAFEPPLAEQNSDQAFEAIIRGLGIKIENGCDSTCQYIGPEDKIRIPHRWMFELGPGGRAGYYDALGHELFHSTEPRVKWDSTDDVAELRAEIGSGYLCGALVITPLPRNLARHHDKYVSRWIRFLQADPKLIERVCSNVTETVAWLLRFAGISSF